MKVQKLLDECKISSRLINYIENFEYPYVNDVQKYYESLLKIGQGTFGEVFKARCKRTGQLVALKKILMENEKEGFPITALREIKMLKLLRHPNITELIEVCTCKQKNARERFSFLFYLVFTFCEHDLAGLLSNSKIKIGLVEIKTMSKHILEGLNKIHKSNILHRDMKSANVLITSDGVLKLADFGLARLMIKQPDFRYTNRVVTLWYRPPELLLGSGNYGPSIDVWGAGCIIAELWIRTPILQGNTEQEQLVRISKLCGSINPDNWPGCEQLPLYGKLKPEFQQINGHNSAIPQNFPRRVRERIGPFLQAWADSQDSTADSEKFAHYLAFTTQQNDQALALIDQMLSLCPEQRPSAEEALDHNFFWEAPLPAENIKDLVDKLKGTNLFEYTSGCGAHANRKQRPVAPAAPGHVNGSGPNQTSRKPAISSNARTHVPPPHQQTRHAAVQIKQVQEFGVATSTKSSSNISEPISRDHRQPVPDNRGFSSTVDNNLQYQQNRKRQAPPIDEHINTPPPISRPTPLAQAGSANRPISGGIWQQPPQQSSHYQQGGPVASSSSQSQQWNSHPQNFTQTGKRGTPQPLHSQPRHAWQPPIQGQHSQSQSQQYLPRTSQFQNRFPAVPAPNSQQAYNRQLPPADRHQQPRYFQ